MQLRPHTQVVSTAKLLGILNFLSLQNLARFHRHKIRVRGTESLSDRFVFFLQQAAGGIDQAPAAFHQTRRALQNPRLQIGQFEQIALFLPPFQIRIAPQRAQAAAWRIHQHAIHLARQTLDPLIALMRDAHRMDIGQAAARQARLHAVQALLRGVKGVEPPGVFHHRAQSERFAARARAEICHHLAALGAREQGQQLRALVLHLHPAVFEQRQLVQGGFAGDAQAPGRERCCF